MGTTISAAGGTSGSPRSHMTLPVYCVTGSAPLSSASCSASRARLVMGSLSKPLTWSAFSTAFSPSTTAASSTSADFSMVEGLVRGSEALRRFCTSAQFSASCFSMISTSVGFFFLGKRMPGW